MIVYQQEIALAEDEMLSVVARKLSGDDGYSRYHVRCTEERLGASAYTLVRRDVLLPEDAAGWEAQRLAMQIVDEVYEGIRNNRAGEASCTAKNG